MRPVLVIAIALAVLGCDSNVKLGRVEHPYDYERYVRCVEAYSPEGWASTTDTHTFCKHAARQGTITQPTGDPQP